VEAAFRKIDGTAVAGVVVDQLEGVDTIEPHAGWIGAIRFFIGKRSGMAGNVPFLAMDRAGLTADTDVQIDDQAEFFGGRLLRQAGHDFGSTFRP
jgi:hypothetical protein